MKLSDRARLVISIPLIAFLCLVPAVFLGFPLDVILVQLRHTNCSADTILVIKPFFGDWAYNIPVILALDLFFLSMVMRWMLSTVGSIEFAEMDRSQLIFAQKATWVPQIVALCGLAFMLCEYNHAQKSCIRGSGIEYRATLGQPVLYPWRAVTKVSVDCVMASGKGNTWDFWLYMTDGKNIGVNLRDITSNPTNQTTFWQHVYDNHIPVMLSAFQGYQPGCWRDFPGLRHPAP